MNILDNYKYKSIKNIEKYLSDSDILLKKIHNIDMILLKRNPKYKNIYLNKIKKRITYVKKKLSKLKDQNIINFFKIFKKKYNKDIQTGGYFDSNLFFNDNNIHYMFNKKSIVLI